jgi:type I restriction enzyme S subunit
MSWWEISFGDAFRMKHGFAFKSRFFSDSGTHVVLTPGNFKEEGGFRSRPGKDRFYTAGIPEDFVLSEGDLIIAMTEQSAGLLGSSALVPESNKYLHNQRLGLIRNLNSNMLDKKFLYYLFNTRSVRSQISGSATGTKVRHTAPERIYRVKALVPKDVAEQKRIVAILSVYDYLIENNRRRIQLLEQAASLLYKEWFVNLRFPGHEHIKINDGVPEGWKRSALGEIAIIFKGKNITKETITDGDIPVVAGGLKPAYFHNVANASGPVITVSASGANAGHVALYYKDIWASDCSFLSSSDNPEIWFLYLAMKFRQAEINGMQQGVAQPHVYPKNLVRLVLLTPPKNLRELFNLTVESIFLQLGNLEKQNERLAEARDLLLPKLMNGDMRV